MKSSIQIVVLFGFMATVFAAGSIGFFHDPDHPGKCVLSPDLILPPGEHKNPYEACGRILCEENGEVAFQNCGVEAPPKGCIFQGFKDISLNYPECCEKEVQC